MSQAQMNASVKITVAVSTVGQQNLQGLSSNLNAMIPSLNQLGAASTFVGGTLQNAFSTMAGVVNDATRVQIQYGSAQDLTAAKINAVDAAAKAAFPSVQSLAYSFRELSAEEKKATKDQDTLVIGITQVDQAVKTQTLSTRAILLDFRMLSFALRTLRTEFGVTDPTVTAVTDGMITLAATATGLVAGFDLLTKGAGPLTRSLYTLATGAAAANLSFTAMGIGILSATWPLLLLAGALIAVNWYASEAGTQAARTAIVNYSKEIEKLNKDLATLKGQQSDLNEETQRYDLLISQIDYQVKLQGYATPEQTQQRAYLESRSDLSGLEQKELRYKETVNQNRSRKGTEAIALETENIAKQKETNLWDWGLKNPPSGIARYAEWEKANPELAQKYGTGQPQALERMISTLTRLIPPSTTQPSGTMGDPIYVQLKNAEENRPKVVTPPTEKPGSWFTQQGLLNPGHQYGFEGVVTQPTQFLAGEAGREQVKITPMDRVQQSSTVPQITPPLPTQRVPEALTPIPEAPREMPPPNVTVVAPQPEYPTLTAPTLPEKPAQTSFNELKEPAYFIEDIYGALTENNDKQTNLAQTLTKLKAPEAAPVTVSAPTVTVTREPFNPIITAPQTEAQAPIINNAMPDIPQPIVNVPRSPAAVPLTNPAPIVNVAREPFTPIVTSPQVEVQPPIINNAMPDIPQPVVNIPRSPERAPVVVPAPMVNVAREPFTPIISPQIENQVPIVNSPPMPDIPQPIVNVPRSPAAVPTANPAPIVNVAREPFNPVITAPQAEAQAPVVNTPPMPDIPQPIVNIPRSPSPMIPSPIVNVANQREQVPFLDTAAILRNATEHRTDIQPLAPVTPERTAKEEIRSVQPNVNVEAPTPIQVTVNFPDAKFSTPAEARQTAKDSSFVITQEIRDNLDRKRYGVSRP